MGGRGAGAVRRRRDAVDHHSHCSAAGRVRVGAGATWGAVAAALSPLGLGLTAGDTNQVGVGGLTLGAFAMFVAAVNRVPARSSEP